MQLTTPQDAVPRIEYLRVRNYRALKDLELKNLTPFTVLLGPNGSGKSTVFDVFAFLSECFTEGLRKAWDRRGRFKELRTRGEAGPIVIELKYRERPNQPIITYHLAIDEDLRGPFVAEEWLKWRRGGHGRPFFFLNFHNGQGEVISGEYPEEEDERIHEVLASPEMFAVNTLGQFTRHPRVSALREFIADWYLSYLNVDEARTTRDAGPLEHLSKSGDNLPNVIQYLKEQHDSVLSEIIATLSQRIPKLQKVDASLMADGRLLLQIKDAPFERPILAKFASDGTLKMLAYLTLLFDPDPPQMIGIEEPENQLHPRLLPILVEEFAKASDHSQLMVTTHSPIFVNSLTPEQLFVLSRDDRGFTQAVRASEMSGIREFVEEGALLGDLWMEGYFTIGDPLNPVPGKDNSMGGV
jgi:predicted ATPase